MANMRVSFADYLYNRLPQVYRTSDTENLLRRFIETFCEAGFDPLLQETVDMMNLLDVDKCPSEFLPLLCSMYGFEYTAEIPELYIRRLLKYIIELYKRKGTKSVVKFIARELTGFDSEIVENKDFTDELVEITKWDIRFEHYRNFVLKLNAPYEDSVLHNREEIMYKLLKDFLPTNSQVFVITVYWFKEDYESNITESVDTMYNVMFDGDFTDLIQKFEYEDTEITFTQKEEEEVTTLTLNVLPMDSLKVKEGRHTEISTTSKVSEESEFLDTYTDFNEEDLEVGRIYHKSCDIMTETSDEVHTLNFGDGETLDTNSFLNHSVPLRTNGLVTWEIIKEQGKPDRIVFI